MLRTASLSDPIWLKLRLGLVLTGMLEARIFSRSSEGLKAPPSASAVTAWRRRRRVKCEICRSVKVSSLQCRRLV
jgi:hypothetical protein